MLDASGFYLIVVALSGAAILTSGWAILVLWQRDNFLRHETDPQWSRDAYDMMFRAERAKIRYRLLASGHAGRRHVVLGDRATLPRAIATDHRRMVRGPGKASSLPVRWR